MDEGEGAVTVEINSPSMAFNCGDQRQRSTAMELTA